MRITPHLRSLRLVADAPASFRRARGAVLECTEGRLWVTIDGQPGDLFLAAGECLQVESDGLGLVEGCPEGRLRFSAAPADQAVLAPSVAPAVALR